MSEVPLYRREAGGFGGRGGCHRHRTPHAFISLFLSLSGPSGHEPEGNEGDGEGPLEPATGSSSPTSKFTTDVKLEDSVGARLMTCESLGAGCK